MERDLSRYYWTSFGSAPLEDIEADIRQAGIIDEHIIRAALEVHPGAFRPWEFLPRPALVAGMAEALHPTEDSNVLEVGTGTGYLTAVLGALSRRVVSFEINPTFAAMARRAIEELPYSRKITVFTGDGTVGYPEEAPYDCIAVHGRVREVPLELKQQLGEGGRMLLAVGAAHNQELQLITRRGAELSTEILGPGGFSPLRGKYGVE